MSPLARFIFLRILSVPLTLFLVSFVMFALVSTAPPEVRAALYVPKKFGFDITLLSREQLVEMTKPYVKRYHMDAPLPVQYGYWVGSLFESRGGYSPTLQMNVIDALLRRSPVTAELTLYSLLVFIPLGILSGLLAAGKQGGGRDLVFRLAAFIATSMPPFILAILLLSIFYVGLRWLPPSRLSVEFSQVLYQPNFHAYTGLLTIDGLLNGNPQLSLDAARHLLLPVFTLSLVHWATLGRITRSSVVLELKREYVLAGKARGLTERRLLWTYALRNALAPCLASAALSAASLFTGVFIVEIIFDFKGIADLIVKGLNLAPDLPASMGFVLYAVFIVLTIMTVLDILQAVFDPRVRERLGAR